MILFQKQLFLIAHMICPILFLVLSIILCLAMILIEDCALCNLSKYMLVPIWSQHLNYLLYEKLDLNFPDSTLLGRRTAVWNSKINDGVEQIPIDIINILNDRVGYQATQYTIWYTIDIE